MSALRILAIVVATAVLALSTVTAYATENNNESARYQYHVEVPNISESADGDRVTVMASTGTFSVHPKTASGGGTFTLTNDGTTLTGTWTALDTIAFQPYGCGVLFGDPIPPNFCGGKLQLRVLLTAGGRQMEGMLTIVCIIGDVPGQYFVSRNATEGILLNVPGVENYNQQVSGMNVFIRTGP
jgi:hypothetical protein